MKKINKTTKERLYNNGERLVPGETHDLKEVVRHRATYDFFRRIIKQDIKNSVSHDTQEKIKILDIGFGSGYGCYLLSQIPNTQVVGIDVENICYEYAVAKYMKDNIRYHIVKETANFLRENQFDYVVSRGVLEHITDGINLVARNANYTKRAMLSVPYKEPAGNIHHILLNIAEADFNMFSGEKEFFYEDWNGKTYSNASTANILNFTACIRKKELLPVINYLSFPLLPEKPEFSIRRSYAIRRIFVKFPKKIFKKIRKAFSNV
ncbi:MAG TPA: class I SAM-dependent methyltransferase [Alphaproteobacteria bacterium]|jgi:SAM-dependent methyltransferase|nr:class I SAM-dependent methyltransferase [Alphaproteobacteria bacterium]